MRILILYTGICMFLGCANEIKTKSETYSVSVTQADIASPNHVSTEKIEYDKIAIEKLNNYFELLQLIKKYPEFNEGTFNEIIRYSKDTLLLKEDWDSIGNIEVIGKIQPISDSTYGQKLNFKKIKDGNSINDSLIAIITLKPLQVDGTYTISTKVHFLSIVNQNNQQQY